MTLTPSPGQMASKFYNLLDIPKGASISQFGSELIVHVRIGGEWIQESYEVQVGDTLEFVRERINQMVSSLTELELCA